MSEQNKEFNNEKENTKLNNSESLSVDKSETENSDDFQIITSSGHRRHRLHKMGENTADETEMMLITSSGHSHTRSHSGNRSSGKSSHKHRKRHRMKTWKKVLISIASVMLVCVLVVTGVLFTLWYKGGQELKVKPESQNIEAPETVEVEDNGTYVVYNGKKYQLNENIISILLIGVDNRELDDDYVIGTAGQADLNILMTVDTSTGEIKLINISRDSMVEINQYSAGGSYMGMSVQQLCLAYTFGDGRETSCENQVRAVERLFYNIKINSYFALDLDGIAVINDSIGGVDVTSPETIDVFEEGETYHLEGELAEKFVRRRDTKVTDSNLNRNKRQKEYINAFIKKVKALTKEDVFTPVNLFNAAADYSCTNLNASKITYLAGVALTNDTKSYEIQNVPGEYKLGDRYAEFYVDENEFYEMFLDVFYTPVENG